MEMTRDGRVISITMEFSALSVRGGLAVIPVIAAVLTQRRDA